MMMGMVTVMMTMMTGMKMIMMVVMTMMVVVVMILGHDSQREEGTAVLIKGMATATLCMGQNQARRTFVELLS